MFVDDDSKEKKVSIAAANVLSMIDPAAPAESPMPATGVGDGRIEELGLLFRDHYKDVFRTAYRITGSQSDAEDVLQTIFLRLTPGGERVGLSANPQAYLRRAAVNASLDLLRSRKRANAVSLDAVDIEQSSKLSGASPEDDLADSELRDLVRQAVAKLGGLSASAFALRYFEGFDNGTIAEIMGTSQLTIAVTLHRARTRLRKEIGHYLEKHHGPK